MTEVLVMIAEIIGIETEAEITTNEMTDAMTDGATEEMTEEIIVVMIEEEMIAIEEEIEGMIVIMTDIAVNKL